MTLIIRDRDESDTPYYIWSAGIHTGAVVTLRDVNSPSTHSNIEAYGAADMQYYYCHYHHTPYCSQ